jgi:hypothetical protein
VGSGHERTSCGGQTGPTTDGLMACAVLGQLVILVVVILMALAG